MFFNSENNNPPANAPKTYIAIVEANTGSVNSQVKKWIVRLPMFCRANMIIKAVNKVTKITLSVFIDLLWF